MKHITNDPRRPLAVAAQQGKYSIHPETGQLYDPEIGRPLHGMLIDQRYELIREIGRGGSCICYHALDRESRSFVAIKEWFPVSFAQEGLLVRQGNTLALTPAGKASEAEILSNFETDFAREADMSARQRHTETHGHLNNDPNVFTSKLLRTGPWMQYLCIETEAGIPLSQIVFNETVPQTRLADILGIGLRIAERLEWLHSQKRMIHCDLKPENLYVSALFTGEKDRISSHVFRVIDYGSGFPLGPDDCAVPESVTHLSYSSMYAAPELEGLRDEDRCQEAIQKLTPATDIYAALRILLELLAPEAAPEDLCSGDLWDSSILKHLPEPVVEHFCAFFENALSTKRLKNADELKCGLEKLKEMAENCISWEWLRHRSEVCAEQQKLPYPLFSVTFRRERAEEQQTLEELTATALHNLLLTGLAGAGKSTIMRQLANQLLKQQETAVPLQIPLREFDSSQHFIKDYILYQILQLKHGDSDEQNRQKLMRLFSQKDDAYYLLLDGYDELPNPNLLYKELAELAACSGVRMIISSRYRPNRPLFEKKFELVEVCPLPKATIKQALTDKSLPGGEDEQVLKMLATPLWLSIYLGLPANGRVAPKTSAELMEHHVAYLLKKAEQNALMQCKEGLLPLMQETLRVLLPRFCWYMMQERRYRFDVYHAESALSVSMQELTQEKAFHPIRRAALPDDSQLTACVIEDVLVPLGLLEGQQDTYAFTHALFRDYFASREVLRQLENSPALPESLSVCVLPETTTAFLAEMEAVDPEVLLNSRCRGRRGTEFAVTVRNLVEIMKLRRGNVLAGMNLSDLDLRETVLTGCELSCNGIAPATLRGSLLAEETFSPSAMEMGFSFHSRRWLRKADEPTLFPIPEQRLFATVQDGKTILWDMDTLCKVWTIPAELFKFFPWEDSLWGWESGEESLWQIDLHTGSHGTYRLQDLAGANVRRWFLKELGCCDGTLCFSAEENGRYRLYQFHLSERQLKPLTVGSKENAVRTAIMNLPRPKGKSNWEINSSLHILVQDVPHIFLSLQSGDSEQLLALLDDSGHIKNFVLHSGKTEEELPGISPIAMSNDGETLYLDFHAEAQGYQLLKWVWREGSLQTLPTPLKQSHGNLFFRENSLERCITLLDANTGWSKQLEDVPEELFPIYSVFRTNAWISVLSADKSVLWILGETGHQEVIPLNRKPVVKNLFTQGETLSVQTQRTQSDWIFEAGRLCFQRSFSLPENGNSCPPEVEWRKEPGVVRVPCSQGMLEAKHQIENYESRWQIVYRPVGWPETVVEFGGATAVVPLEGALMIQRAHESCPALYQPDPKDLHRLSGMFLYPLEELSLPKIGTRWKDGVAVYDPTPLEPGVQGTHGCVYYITQDQCQHIIPADLLVKGCDLTDCEGLSNETKALLKTYGANV